MSHEYSSDTAAVFPHPAAGYSLPDLADAAAKNRWITEFLSRSGSDCGCVHCCWERRDPVNHRTRYRVPNWKISTPCFWWQVVLRNDFKSFPTTSSICGLHTENLFSWKLANIMIDDLYRTHNKEPVVNYVNELMFTISALYFVYLIGCISGLQCTRWFIGKSHTKSINFVIDRSAQPFGFKDRRFPPKWILLHFTSSPPKKCFLKFLRKPRISWNRASPG